MPWRVNAKPINCPLGGTGCRARSWRENQRERILAAVADVVSAASYGELTVEGIIVTAGISRRTFYEHFKNKDEAFLAAYDAITAQLVAEVLPAVDAADGFAARVTAGLGTFLDFLAGEAAFARMCIVEALAAGPDAIRRRNDTMRSFADLIDRNAQELLTDKVAPGLTAELIVGGIYEVVYTRVLQGRDPRSTGPAAGSDLLRPAALSRARGGGGRASQAARQPAGRLGPRPSVQPRPQNSVPGAKDGAAAGFEYACHGTHAQ